MYFCYCLPQWHWSVILHIRKVFWRLLWYSCRLRSAPTRNISTCKGPSYGLNNNCTGQQQVSADDPQVQTKAELEIYYQAWRQPPVMAVRLRWRRQRKTTSLSYPRTIMERTMIANVSGYGTYRERVVLKAWYLCIKFMYRHYTLYRQPGVLGHGCL